MKSIHVDSLLTECRAKEILLQCQKHDDTERAHSAADSALVAFIRDLGYDSLADECEKVDKWFA